VIVSYTRRRKQTVVYSLLTHDCNRRYLNHSIFYEFYISLVIEISESVHRSRRCYTISFISVWNEILLGSQGTVNQKTSCQHTHSQKCSTLERYSRVRIEIKHLLAHLWFNSYAQELTYPCFFSAIKHGYRCFIS